MKKTNRVFVPELSGIEIQEIQVIVRTVDCGLTIHYVATPDVDPQFDFLDRRLTRISNSKYLGTSVSDDRSTRFIMTSGVDCLAAKADKIFSICRIDQIINHPALEINGQMLSALQIEGIIMRLDALANRINSVKLDIDETIEAI
jgi:hypothetical protein